MSRQARAWKVGVASIVLAGAAWAQVTQRVSINSRGAQGKAASYGRSISPDGRYVLFMSFASNLVAGDTNGTWDVFLRDRVSGTTERVSLGTGGTEANDWSEGGRLSADGRYVLFVSNASNLVANDTNGHRDVFVRDRLLGTTELVSIDSNGNQGNDESFPGGISADGRFVAFGSWASNLVPGDTNNSGDIFVRDRRSHTTERVSVDSNGAQGQVTFDTFEVDCDISSDGRFVVFVSDAWNLVPADLNIQPDVFVRDRLLGSTERASVSSTGEEQLSWNLEWFDCSISPDGRYVGFTSDARNLVPGDTNARYDVFLHDRLAGTTERVSVDSNGAQVLEGGSGSSISEGGRYVVFQSRSSLIGAGDTNGKFDVYLRDRLLQTTERVSLGAGDMQANADTTFDQISPDGRFVILDTRAGNFMPGDTNLAEDAFVRDRFGGPTFTSICSPGVAGVMGCPCSNPPPGSDQGCDNSAATGGATLSASGGTYLSSDSLRFTATGEPANALSMLLQGDALIPTGAVFGQGVRCVGGTLLRRLFVDHAVGGSITVPDFQGGNPTVSSRSASKGDLIHPGDSRYYLVYYRDPIVLGGCPASSTFNATQTGVVTWSP